MSVGTLEKLCIALTAALATFRQGYPVNKKGGGFGPGTVKTKGVKPLTTWESELS